ncbi:MAG: hypothetical protein OES79_08450 [Planctomycetota bacterium]|nr:hypothetical protein [Planctomycetota bacterium]
MNKTFQPRRNRSVFLTMAEQKLLATPFFFRFALPCPYREPLWSGSGVQLDDACRLPTFGQLDSATGDERVEWAELRAAWSENGLAFNLIVSGKKKSPWCRASRIEDSDGFAVWVDTRNTSGIHRANRFCHAFRFLPAGATGRPSQPVAVQLAVERARENPKPVDSEILKVRSDVRQKGYRLEAFVPAAALTGFDPAEQPQLGFTYAAIDRELGEQTLTVGSEFPYQSDPSLWSTLDLVR